MDDLKAIFAVFIVIGTFCLLTAIGCETYSDVGHRHLGSKGHTCFANHTCREGLRCADGGPDGICVGK